MAEQPAMLKINDVDYKIDDLSEDAIAQLRGVQVADEEIKRLNMQIALMQTARNAYMQSLQEQLPDQE